MVLVLPSDQGSFIDNLITQRRKGAKESNSFLYSAAVVTSLFFAHHRHSAIVLVSSEEGRKVLALAFCSGGYGERGSKYTNTDSNGTEYYLSL